MPSIRDVAAVAGVSDRTVSRVVHEDKRVDPKTRARVKKAIDDIGYIPNRGALLMRTNRSAVIGVMTDVVSTTPFSTDIIRGIQNAIDGTKYSLLTVNTAGDAAQTRRCWQELKGHRVDGVIFVTMYQRMLAHEEIASDVKTVTVNCHPASSVKAATILPEEEKGMREAVSAAVDMGHTRIGYIRLNLEVMAAAQREQALRSALADRGIQINERWFAEGAVGPVFSDRFVAYENAKAILSDADRPTVLFCGNDEIALQVFSAAAALGLKVPEDLSLIGFDDFRVVTEVMHPNLATVALPYFEMGRMAVSDMITAIDGHEDATSRHIECRFVPRGSLGPPPALKGH